MTGYIARLFFVILVSGLIIYFVFGINIVESQNRFMAFLLTVFIGNLCGEILWYLLARRKK